ncbi:MAG: CarD family transcriptional regulator [bacterium]|nr:CarD family transcriptional regulator [bacterium]
MENRLSNVLIVSITPYFLEKEFFWFQENIKTILQSAKTQAFWQDNILFLEKDQKISISEVLKKIDELGYEKVFKTTQPGEFSQIGGIIEIFSINSQFAVRLDFLGNRIESIERLNIEVENEKISKELLKKKLKSQKIFSDLKGLKSGDYLVHLDHGVARYTGKSETINQNTEQNPNDQNIKPKEYYVLEYAVGDKLYVPVGLERKLNRYIGFTEPKLSRLGGILWQKTKKKIKEDTEKLAKDLLEMFAQKEICQRPAYLREEIFETLSSGFPYKLTPDQEETLRDIKENLKLLKPMDRIVCGDVGFGKTEIALRVAGLSAENGKQTALICPTTILASQHYQTFKKRFANLPVNIALLSRLQTAREKQTIKEKLKSGEIDIVVGTHSLLAKSIEFKNLGLLIIDDEQKFGVKQKEILRTKYPHIDVLSLSATPIPRTMYLALSSLKEMSFIQTPPQGRKAIKTYVLPFKKEVIKKAIEAELARNGQIYFLHNRIGTLPFFKQLLEDLGTQAKIGILHSKLKEQEIIKTLSDFQIGKTNLLLTTTIIENGIDITNANTLIVDNATRLGLSQAYQLRGRIGRGTQQSFAYFLYPKGQLKGLAKQRLTALKQAEELGSGYKIATQDMEIRGAGNILGKEQSGSVNRIGLNLYCQMLGEAVEKLKTNICH